jgi:hypothetical protein
MTVELVAGNCTPGRASGAFGLLTSKARITAARRLGFLLSFAEALVKPFAEILPVAGNGMSEAVTPWIIG